MQELIRRAPGTYNHSITVASLAEAAAEAIGARGLLVRVGAYFHDIGKMLKPGYFVENQGQGDNRHQSLVPAMSTLVIIAHVKDGADLARQTKIPEPIIDFIQQHHGTTLVEYFYRQASERSQGQRHRRQQRGRRKLVPLPGPEAANQRGGHPDAGRRRRKRQPRAGRADAGRIESLVEEISRKRLLDGQFDECGLTLEEVRRIGDSLVKSLTAVYHGRVKYPGPRNGVSRPLRSPVGDVLPSCPYAARPAATDISSWPFRAGFELSLANEQSAHAVDEAAIARRRPRRARTIRLSLGHDQPRRRR